MITMKFQLTKGKTCTLALPWEKERVGSGVCTRKGPREVTGVLVGCGDKRGCPAVRLLRRKSGVTVQALGFIPSPGTLPGSWEELKKKDTWDIPAAFQAPQAAIAVVSKDSFIRQTTMDVLTGEMKLTNSATPLKPLQPISRNGIRSVVGTLAEEPFALHVGMPEYQVLWLSRLLPEGRRPTACSVQTACAAALSALSSQPEFIEADGTAVAVFVLRQTIFFAGYREGEIVLFRECPGGIGSLSIHEQVRISLGVDDEIVDSFLEEGLVDPTPVLEPIMRPVLQQLQLSLEYLAQRHDVHVKHVFLLGLPSGAAYWNAFAQELIGMPLIYPGLFEGMEISNKGGVPPELATPVASQAFLAAFGAARAAMGVA